MAWWKVKKCKRADGEECGACHHWLYSSTYCGIGHGFCQVFKCSRYDLTGAHWWCKYYVARKTSTITSLTTPQ